ncbi:DUF723 domain-containing protein [Neisseria leonii]|uniref:DUF723 domain-containing protein n=1 Tax=Neisseria leonii TaxID=2995413 RepID=A0A9X4IBV6_9NEIS|nr:DUF723 domain-containing protein [Neisseria sp. 51.81]MDD9328809.1 DUF723 domain-containing protein [Neisseria sp. 51.81]
MAMTFEQACERVETVFSHVRLTEFSGVKYPCKVFCETHGEVEWSTYKALMASTQGCPKCAEGSRRRNIKEGLRQAKSVKQHLEEVADRLVSERIRLRLSRIQVAQALRVESNHWIGYESAVQAVPPEVYEALSNLDFDVDYILTGLDQQAFNNQ